MAHTHPLPARRVTHLVAIKQNITERLLAEDCPRETEQFFRGVLKLAPDGLMVADTNGIIRLANARCGKLFGCTRDELIGQPVETLVPEEASTPTIRLFAKLSTARPLHAAWAPAVGFAAAARTAPSSPWKSALAPSRPGGANAPRPPSPSATSPCASSSPSKSPA